MMDYKKLFKNQETRQRILDFFSFVPDVPMLKLQYFLKQGHTLDFRHPVLYTEKLQWYKVFYRNPLMVRCVDKYDVRSYVEHKGLAHILNDCYGIFGSEKEVSFSALPNAFVVKDTLGGGSRSVIVVPDKSKMDVDYVASEMNRWCNLPCNKRTLGREWPYYSGKRHRIIIEKYLEAPNATEGLIDYKFFCFNGKPEYLYVIADRAMGKNAAIGIYDASYTRLPVDRADERPLTREIPKPKCFDEMLAIAGKLSEDFPHVRVDLYNIDGKIIFGEMTFYPGSGYMQFTPAEFDKTLGDCFVLPKTEDALKNG